MIKRQQLKCPLIALIVMTGLAILIQITLIVLMPVFGYIGYNLVDAPTSTCSNTYLILKLASTKYILASGFSSLLLAFICTVIALITIVICLTKHLKQQKSEQNKQTSENPQNQNYQDQPLNYHHRTVYDSYFTLSKLIILYICYSLAICWNILQAGDSLWVMLTYALCSANDTLNLVVISALGFASCALLLACWIIVIVLCCKVNKFKDEHEEIASEMPIKVRGDKYRITTESDTLMNINTENNQNYGQAEPYKKKVYHEMQPQKKSIYESKARNPLEKFETPKNQNFKQQDNYLKRYGKDEQNNHRNPNKVAKQGQRYETQNHQWDRDREQENYIRKYDKDQSNKQIIRYRNNSDLHDQEKIKETPKFEENLSKTDHYHKPQYRKSPIQREKQRYRQQEYEDRNKGYQDYLIRQSQLNQKKPYFKSPGHKRKRPSEEQGRKNNPFDKFEKQDEISPIQKFYRNKQDQEPNRQSSGSSIGNLSPIKEEKPKIYYQEEEQDKYHKKSSRMNNNDKIYEDFQPSSQKRRANKSNYFEYIRGKYEY